MINIDFSIQEIFDDVSDEQIYRSHYMIRDGFIFTSLTKDHVFDALVVKECVTDSAYTRTVAECIDLINCYELKSAIFITNDFSVVKQCPTVVNFTLYLDPDNRAPLQYASLSLLPGIRQFSLGSKFGITELCTGGNSPLVFQKLKTLKRLNMYGDDDKSGNKKTSISTIENLDLPELIKLSIIQCGITSLNGIQNCPKLQWLDLSYMRNLSDLSALTSLSSNLRMLSIESCPKITDLSAISALKELEYLELKGKNEIPDLGFMKELPKLKFLILTMNVLDGDVSCLKNLQYVDIVSKRHYNLKNKDLPKDTTGLGFEFI